MPNFQQIKEWDDTTAVATVRHIPFSRLSMGQTMVEMEYDDGVVHTVTEAHYNSIHVKECCCICGDSRESDSWECPGCGTV